MDTEREGPTEPVAEKAVKIAPAEDSDGHYSPPCDMLVYVAVGLGVALVAAVLCFGSAPSMGLRDNQLVFVNRTTGETATCFMSRAPIFSDYVISKLRNGSVANLPRRARVSCIKIEQYGKTTKRSKDIDLDGKSGEDAIFLFCALGACDFAEFFRL